MSRRGTVTVLALLACLAIGVLILSSRLGEPIYRGKSLSHWLELLEQRDDVEGVAEARIALRRMGTNALPHLLSMLQTKDSELKRWLQQLEARQSIVGLGLNSADAIRHRAAAGIVAMGPLAAPLVPALTNLLDDVELGPPAVYALSGIGPEALGPLLASLNHSNTAVRRTAAFSLAGFAGAGRKTVCTALLQATNNTDPPVRRAVFRALGQMTNHWEIAMPAVTCGLLDPDLQVSRICLLNVGNFGSNALTAIPALKAALDNRRTYSIAARSFRRIEPRAALVSHLENLQGSNEWKRVQAAASLSEFGRDAMDAVPLLLQGLSDPAEHVKSSCAFALQRIDPESATKAGVDASLYRPPPGRGYRPAYPPAPRPTPP